jgi:hypothetical protein
MTYIYDWVCYCAFKKTRLVGEMELQYQTRRAEVFRACAEVDRLVLNSPPSANVERIAFARTGPLIRFLGDLIPYHLRVGDVELPSQHDSVGFRISFYYEWVLRLFLQAHVFYCRLGREDEELTELLEYALDLRYWNENTNT